jgi:hypothetical protein
MSVPKTETSVRAVPVLIIMLINVDPQRDEAVYTNPFSEDA